MPVRGLCFFTFQFLFASYMSEDFDPYLEWFGIEPSDHPIDFYQLIGVESMENDVELLDSTIQSHMERLHALQSGPRGKYTQNILNELVQARLVFSDPERKQIYDDELELADQEGLVIPSQVVVPSEDDAETISNELDDDGDDLIVPSVASDTVTPKVSVARDVEYVSSQSVYRPRVKDSRNSLVLFMGIGLIAGVGVLVWSALSLTGESTVDEKQQVIAADTEPSTTDEPSGEETEQEATEILARQEGTGEVIFVLAAARRSQGVSISTVDRQDRLTGWSKAGDTIELDFHIAQPGPFTLLIGYEVPDDASGGDMQLKVNDGNPRSFSLRKDIIEGQMYTDEVSVLITKSGKQTLRLAVEKCYGEALMNLATLKLKPN